MPAKVFVLGLDGATFDLILPWAAKGKLPNFSRLLDEASWAPLESVPNMRSAAAWTSFMTGKNPGKHGIFEFYEPVPQSYDVRFVNGGTRKDKSLWTILSEAKRRVGVINVPMTYPAEKVNGFLIAGLDAPGPESHGFFHPTELHQELQDLFGRYILEPGLTGCIVGGNIDLALQRLQKELRQKERITAHLMQRYAWDFFMVVFRSLDAVQHCFWKHMDSTHPHHDPAQAEQYGSVILWTYKKIDEILGTIRTSLDEDTTLIVMSDHGFGQKHPANNQLNSWLASRGFLNFYGKERERGLTKRMATRLLAHSYRLLIGRTPRAIKERLSRLFPQLRNQVQSLLCHGKIDWSRTKAYSDSLFPIIRINLEGREPEGIVKPGHEYQQLLETIRQALLECRDETSGRRIVDGVFFRDEIYFGPQVEKAPDLLVRWKEEEKISGIALPDGALDSSHTSETARPLVPGEDSKIISGDHRLHGVFLMSGKQIREGFRIPQPNIVDLAPTILQLMGLPIPSDMDGCVLSESFRDKAMARPHHLHADVVKETSTDHAQKQYSAEEQEAVSQRLRDLGYLA
jgi:predicted AlkP superfamily phosphohydrolase/phosphomutase